VDIYRVKIEVRGGQQLVSCLVPFRPRGHHLSYTQHLALCVAPENASRRYSLRARTREQPTWERA
jgi:hypothetical protein